MTTTGRGRTVRKTSAYHQRLHEQAATRAKLMAEMRAAGMSYFEIGRRFKTSENAVRCALRRQGLLK